MKRIKHTLLNIWKKRNLISKLWISDKRDTFRDFKESAAFERSDIKGYSQSYIFAKREQGRFIIEVKYILRDSPSTSDLITEGELPPDQEKTFSRPMIQEEGLWKVQFFGDY